MRPRWRLLVEGLGRIERAEVEVRPLMLFYGDNGAGKTRLASLLWGLLAMQWELSLPPGQALDDCERWIARRAAAREEQPSYPLTDADCALFAKLFNESLARDGEHLVQRVMNSSKASVSKVQVENPKWTHRPRIAFQVGAGDPNSGRGDTIYVSSDLLTQMGPAYQKHIIKSIAAHVTVGRAASHTRRAEGPFQSGDPIFLPASRTGFMLLYRAVVVQRLERLGLIWPEPQRGAALELTSPMIQFLSLLSAGLKYERGPYQDEAADIEQFLRGRLELVTGIGANDYRYHPRKGAPLSMAQAPSMVTELGPLVLVLRHVPNIPVLILEEPTALLHPRLHRPLARVIARLIHKGLYVWITTTRASFFREINHFLKIGASADRAAVQAELGYGDLDYLEAEDIGGYHFALRGEEAVVTEITKREGGLVLAG